MAIQLHHNDENDNLNGMTIARNGLSIVFIWLCFSTDLMSIQPALQAGANIDATTPPS